MKLSEYIEILKTFPPDLDVYIEYDSDYQFAKSPEIESVEVHYEGYLDRRAGYYERMKKYNTHLKEPEYTKDVLVISNR